MPAFDGPVTALLHTSNAWYVGGDFAHVSPYHPRGIVELGVDGKLGSCLGGFDGGVNAIAFSQGAVFVGGGFTEFRGVAVANIAKLDPVACTLDATFSPSGSTAFNGAVNAIVVAGGALYVGGSFTTYRGAPANAIAKLDPTTGAPDTVFSPPAANGFLAGNQTAAVSTIVAVGGSLLVGGFFTDYRGVAGSANAIAKLDATTGAIDTTFNPPANNGFDCDVACIPLVYAMAVAGSSVYVSGGFSHYRGTAATNVVRLDLASGALDTTVDFSQFAGGTSQVTRLAISGNTLFAAGGFNAYRGQTTNCVVAIDAMTGAPTHSFDECDAPVIAVDANALYIAQSGQPPPPQFTTTLRKYSLATLAEDHSFASDIGAAVFNSWVSAIASDGTQLWVGGDFTMYSGYEIHGLVKLDDVTLQPDLRFSPPLPSDIFGFTADQLAATDDGLFVWGQYDAYRGADVMGVLKLDLASGDLIFTVPIAGMDQVIAIDGTSLYGSRFDGNTHVLSKYDARTGAEDQTFAYSAHSGPFALATTSDALYRCSYDGVVKLDLVTGAVDPGFAATADGEPYRTCLATSDALVLGTSSVTGSDGQTGLPLAIDLDLATGAPIPAFSAPVDRAPGQLDDATALAATADAVYVGLYDKELRKLARDTGAPDDAFHPDLGESLTDALVPYAIAPVRGALLVGGNFATPDGGAYLVLLDASTGAVR